MDKLAAFNQARWDELARANVEYSQPRLDLDQESARDLVDPQGLVGELVGKRVLCLASGGGQQSAAFGLLGAQVTVVDLAEAQLEKDRQAAVHYGLDVRILQGDMRDLGLLETDTFDLVWQSYSINFVPSVERVFDEVSRVLRPSGLYMLEFGNPFTFFSGDEDSWNGKGYLLKVPYIDGQEITELVPEWGIWDVEHSHGEWIKVPGPKEFRHALGTVINGLACRHFVVLGLWENMDGDLDAQPGSWEHYLAYAPPWMKVWCCLRPDLF